MSNECGWTRVGNPLTIYRGVLGPPGPKLWKSLPGPPAPGQSGEISKKFRNQEKGVLAKGVSAGSGVNSKKSENCQGYWAQQCIRHTERHSQERRICSQKAPSKNPLFLVPEKYLFRTFARLPDSRDFFETFSGFRAQRSPERIREWNGFPGQNKSTRLSATLFRKVWVSIKFLSAKIGLTPSPPPQKRTQNTEILYKSIENPQNWHFFRRGGGERNFMDKTIL